LWILLINMHAIKKVFHKVGPVSEDIKIPVNAEFADLKGKLDMTSTALKTLETNIKQAEKEWKSIFETEAKALEEVATRYPEGDATRDSAKSFSDAAYAMLKQYQERSVAQMDYHVIADKVKGYIAEITALGPDYTKLESLRVEYEMYSGKMKGLESKDPKNEKGEHKLHRNEEKLASAKSAYEEKLQAVTSRQKELLNLMQSGFKAAFTSFFLLQAYMMDAMDSNGKPIYDYSEKYKTAMLAEGVSVMAASDIGK